MTKDMKSLFKQAAEIAAQVPESMHDAAFNRALDMLMQEQGLTPKPSASNAARRGATPRRKESPSPSDSQDIVDGLMHGLNRTEHPEVAKASRVLDRSLYLLRAAKDKLNIDGLTPPQIARVLTDKFRVKTTQPAVSMALAAAGDKVDRERVGGAFVYRIMGSGEAYLDGPRDKESPAPSRRTKPRKPKGRLRSAPGRQAQAKNGNSKPTRRSGRPGPKAMIENLLDGGFFSQGRTISQIQKHLQKAEGRPYKPTELSPALLRLLRQKRLARDENADGQYEYKAR